MVLVFLETPILEVLELSKLTMCWLSNFSPA